MNGRHDWVLEFDIKGMFDTIDHGWLMKFIEHRIADPRVLRLIRKWLRAGVSEDGAWSKTEVGTPQGAVVRKRGLGKPETFDFLGFTHICSTTRKEKRFTIKRKTIAKRLRRMLNEVKQHLRRMLHEPIVVLGKWLRTVVWGFMNYYAVPGNFASIKAFRTQVARTWPQVLRRRSQKHRLTWERFRCHVDRWLPKCRILHMYPNARFHAIHSKQEPYEVIPHVRICAGAPGNRHSYHVS